MKIMTSALALLTVLSVSILAQTSSATEPVLQIKHVVWFENVAHLPCDDCYGGTPAAMPQVALNYRHRHAPGAGDFSTSVVLKNLSRKTIKSISLDFVFRETATDQEFLTYHLRFEKEIGRGKTKEIQHKIAKGKEPDNFRPVGPSDELLSRTAGCGYGPLLRDRKTGQFLRIRDHADLVKAYPCYYTHTVTQIEYTDGSVWRP